MARDIKVHKGHWERENGEKVPAAWVETSLDLEPEVHDLVDGLGSKYFRHEVMDDDTHPSDRPDFLPATLTQRQILKIYRDELLEYGKGYLGLWAEDAGPTRHKQVEEWLVELVVGAFPEMRDYAR